MNQPNNQQVLYSSNYQITTQDVLDEIALAISISGCPLHCPGCHSSFTWNPTFGEKLTNELLQTLIDKNPHISCVLFYGGEWRIDRLIELIDVVKSNNLKVCLYTGLMLEEIKNTHRHLLHKLDYLKVGRWITEKGGLNKKTTNQKFYKIISKKYIKTHTEKYIDGYQQIEIDDLILIDWTTRFFQI